MGGFFDSVSSNYQDPRFSKHVYDNVHGNIYLDPLSLKFIDTEQFQRLRDLKQLGMAHMVYPGAVHSRFEHSLGVYSLAGEAIHKLKNQQGLELGIDHFDVQTVKLAGLLHDLGHGPFSHLFEREFLPMVNGSEWSHEEMSAEMIDHIVDDHHIEIDSGTTKKIKEMILASSKYSMTTSGREKHFLYDIVANGRNGVDVDKFDYIVRDCRACGLGCSFHFQRLLETMRVIGDEICYRDKDYLTIHKLFSTRADLHRTVYTHAKVKAIELMILDALVRANEYLQIASYIHDPSQYWKLDDTIIKTIETAPDQELKESRDLILRIRRRDLYQFCNEYVVPKDKLENFKNVTAQDIVCSQKNGGVTLREEDVVVSNVRIDLTRGSCNPLERIKFFKDYDSEEKFSIADDRVSHLLPASYQDMIVRVYSKKPELVGVVSEAFENFQLMTYGIKTQVHTTPNKKKRWMDSLGIQDLLPRILFFTRACRPWFSIHSPVPFSPVTKSYYKAAHIQPKISSYILQFPVSVWLHFIAVSTMSIIPGMIGLKDVNKLPECGRTKESSCNGNLRNCQVDPIEKNAEETQKKRAASTVDTPINQGENKNWGEGVANSEIEYIESENLEDVEDVQCCLKTLLLGLSSKDWISVCDALNNVRRLSIFHKDDMAGMLTDVISLVVKSLKNPRSAVCKTAVMTSADIFKAYGDDIIDSLDPLLVQLLLKSSQDKRFVCEAAESALTVLTNWVSPLVLLPKLQPHIKNRNPRIRAKASVCISKSVPRLGAEGIEEFGMDKLIQIGASQLSDQLPESRDGARMLLLELQSVYEKSRTPEPIADVSDKPVAASWQDFCESKLSPLSAQAVLRVTSIAPEEIVLRS